MSEGCQEAVQALAECNGRERVDHIVAIHINAFTDMFIGQNIIIILCISFGFISINVIMCQLVKMEYFKLDPSVFLCCHSQSRAS